MEHIFDRINEYTYEYNIEGGDLTVDENYKRYKLTSLQSEEVQREAKLMDESSPLDMYLAGKVKTSKDEEIVLKRSINYYLSQLGLNPVENVQEYPMHFLSTKGDALIQVALLDYFTNRRTLEILSSNASMQLALGRLGFYEFLEVDTHLAGTFFEVLYACAVFQQNSDVCRKFELTLIGEEPMKERLFAVKFKK